MIRNIIRALRLPFTTASVLPFLFGSLIGGGIFNFWGFMLGLVAAVSTHLSANLINDYADSNSGVDWQDTKFYNFFGGSKLIQEKIFTEKFYLVLAVSFAIISAISVLLLALALKSLLVIGLYLIIIILGWMYSLRPLQFSYHRLGELIIFILFGPAPVLGGYFIQTGIFPDLRGFMLSLPFGFLTTAILFVNEIPDYSADRKAGKFTLVSLTGEKKAYILYYFLILFAFASIAINGKLAYLNKFSFLSFAFILLVFKILNILEKHPDDKMRLIESSKLTIVLQASIGIILIISLIL
jgi:1,4-dihydroxy-2-naphthoate octaprenyltransferase